MRGRAVHRSSLKNAKFVKEHRAEGQTSRKMFISRPCGKASPLRHDLVSEKGDDASRDGGHVSKCLLEALVGSFFDFDRREKPFGRRSKLTSVTQESSRFRLTQVCQKFIRKTASAFIRQHASGSSEIQCVRRQRNFKAGGRRVVDKAGQTPQKVSTLNFSIAKSLSIFVPTPRSYWQRSHITVRRLSTTLVRSACRIRTPIASSSWE